MKKIKKKREKKEENKIKLCIILVYKVNIRSKDKK